MTPCPHPDCGGLLTPAGFCQRTGRRVDRTAGRHAGTPAPAPAPPGPAPQDDTHAALTARVVLPGQDKSIDPLALPDVLPAAPVAAPDDDEGLRSLALGPDRMLAGQYRVLRQVGYGGMGEVHLAEDTRLENRPVAIKFLHQHDTDPNSELRERGRLNEKVMSSERQQLVALNHPDLIRVFNYGRHEPVGEFLVLEYANGLTLEEVRVRVARDPEAFGGVRFHEFVLGYGIRILQALSHLHEEKGKVYGDLKPHNVMHCGTGIKIVDVGSIRQEGAEGPTTDRYRAPDVGKTGATRFQDDLFSLGVTLRELSEAAPPAQGLGPESLRRVLDRATRPDRRARFATADEMALQLRGVLRELRSLRTGQESFEPSPLFVQSAHALDGTIGSPPSLHQLARGAQAPAALGAVPPEHGEMACGLPVPRTDPDDLNAPRLNRLAEDDPTALLQRTADWDPSAELHLLRCRLHMTRTVAADGAGPPCRVHGAGDECAGPLCQAYTEVAEARKLIDPRWAPYDWRIDWHRGLLALAGGNIQQADMLFDGIYGAIPGEYAPKIALGYCAEQRQDRPRALKFYDAVRRRNHSFGGAAFGCARVHLAGPGTEGLNEALAALELVPAHSRHLTAARTAVVRIKAARARIDPGPGDEALKDALHRLGPLFDQHGLTDQRARRRLETELWETVLTRVPPRSLAELTAGLADRLTAPVNRQQLKELLSQLYRGLADQARRSDLPDSTEIAEALIDRANEVRPLGFRHDRRYPWLGQTHRQRIRDLLNPLSASK
ncbi:protein kinase [Streptomyces sp. NBC_01267]|uniref:serine/threonine protein kinase n=1 Tax=Streptomyces sp. NBC_01267 TaxID=2903805 RepID=UPI002E30EBDA|nr:tetratricopeptide repeat protein [Streptomyces sp. NBC_01267]